MPTENSEPVSEAVESVASVAEPVSNTVESAVASVLEPVSNTAESAAVFVSEPVSNTAESAAASVPEPVSNTAESAAASVPEPVSNTAESAAVFVSEPVSNTAESAAASVPEPVSNTAESAAASVPEPVFNTVESAAVSVSEPVSNTAESAAASVAEPVSNTAESAAASVPEPVSNTVESAAVFVPEPVSNTVESAVASVLEPVSNTVESAAVFVSEPVSNTAESAAASVPEPVSNTVESAAVSVSESVSNTVESAAASVPEPVSNTVESAAASVSEPVSNTAESAAASVPEPVSNTVESAAVSVSEPVSEAVESAAVNVESVADSVTYSPPDDAAFEEISDGKETKARRAFNITALLKNKLFLICAAAILVFLILIIIAVNMAIAGADKNPLKGFYYSVYADGETVFLYNGKLIKGTDFSGGCKIAAISSDGTAALVVDDSTLTLLSNGKVNKITDDLDSSTAVLSANGKTAVYLSDGELVAFSGGKKTTITELGTGKRANYVVSPDGGTVVFAEYEDGLSIKSVSAWKGGKLTDLDAKFKPIAVSNGGKMVYGIKNSNDLVYIKNLKAGSDEKIRETSGIIDSTADNSGIIFGSASNTYYFDASTSDAIKITGRNISVIDAGGYPIQRSNFKNFYALGNNGVYRFTRKGSDFDSDKIISGAYRVKLSADGNTFIYIDDDELIKVSASNPGKENVIGDEIYSYNCDPSLKYVYYLDDDGDLRYASSKKTKIGSDIMFYTVNFDGVCVFSDDDGDLYYSSRGGDKKKVSGISDVEQITLINGLVYVRADGTLYVTEDGKKFTKTGVEF